MLEALNCPACGGYAITSNDLEGQRFSVQVMCDDPVDCGVAGPVAYDTIPAEESVSNNMLDHKLEHGHWPQNMTHVTQAAIERWNKMVGQDKQEVMVLRQYGNKDCTIMADEHLTKLRDQGNYTDMEDRA